jgi:hypothetical protein
MREFEVYVDLSKVYYKIKGYKLREYAKPYPVIKITAASPDHACYLISKNLLELLEDQFGVNSDMLSEVRHGMKIKKMILKDND